MRQSQVNLAIDQGKRIILPRPCDLVEANQELVTSPSVNNNIGIQLLGLDISDAFHQVPSHLEERHLTAVAILGCVYLFYVLVFGSTSAPTVWGRYAAWLGRCTTAICGADSFRMLMYVDDPVYAAAGTDSEIVTNLSVAVLRVAIVGFPLAWHKRDGEAHLFGSGQVSNSSGIALRCPSPPPARRRL